MTGRDWDDATREVDALLALGVRMRRIVVLQDAVDLHDALTQAQECLTSLAGVLYPLTEEEADEVPV